MGSVYVSNIALDTTETTEIGRIDSSDELVLRILGDKKIVVSRNSITYNVASVNVASLVANNLVMVGANTNTLTLLGTPSIPGDVSVQDLNVGANTINVATLIVNGNTYVPGGWTVINSMTVSGVTACVIPNLGSYKHLRITLSGITLGNVNNCFLQFQFGTPTTPNAVASYASRAWGANSGSSGNVQTQYSTSTAQTKMLIYNRDYINTGYTTAISNNALHGGFDGQFIISSFGEAQKTKLYGTYVYETHSGMHFAQVSCIKSDQQAQNSVWIAANSASGAVGTFSGSIVTEGLL